MRKLIGSFRWQGKAEPWPLDRTHNHGPDAEDITWRSSDDRCWLAHQPITSHCGRFTLVLSGQIYNHQEVRLGLRFDAWSSQSALETLVEGLAQRGPAIVLELRGMFVFAAYDSEKEQLLLGRDRLGIKPLYLRWQTEELQFASQRRALAGGDQLEAQTISQVLAFGHDCTPASFPGPKTTGIVSFPTGMVVRINHNRPHDPVRYWPPQPRPDWTPLPIRSSRWSSNFLRQQLEEAVAQHLIADVPVVCLLSTTLESGILASLACRQQPASIFTITVALPGSPEDERIHARQIAHYCGSHHHEMVIQEADALAWVEQALTALDVPTANGITTYLINRTLADQGIKVALSSLGADELFGGYSSQRLMPMLQLLRWLPARIRQNLLQHLTPTLSHKLSGTQHWDPWHLGLALRRWASTTDLEAAGAEPLFWPESPPQRITQIWGQTSWAELFGYTEPMLLRDIDAMSMACGLELRLPFLDHKIVEICLRMPQSPHHHGKRLLRQAYSDLFPSTRNLKRPKQGFKLPMSAWMRGPLRQLCLERITSLELSDCLDPAWINQQWGKFEAGQLTWQRCWILVVLGEFFTRRNSIKLKQ